MRLSAKPITTFNGLNSFVLGNQWQIRASEANTLYFQLVDLDQKNLRYIPLVVAGSPPILPIMTVTFPSIDDSAILNIVATQVNSADGSLWQVDLTDMQVPGSGNVVFALNENGVIRRFSVINMLTVEFPGNDGDC